MTCRSILDWKWWKTFKKEIQMSASGDESWDEMAPSQVAEIIRQHGFSGYAKKE